MSESTSHINESSDEPVRPGAGEDADMVDNSLNDIAPSQSALGRRNVSRDWIILLAGTVLFMAVIVLEPNLVWPMVVTYGVFVSGFIWLRTLRPGTSENARRVVAGEVRMVEQRNAVIDALQNAAFLLDRNGGLRYGNEASRRTFGDIRRGERLTNILRQPSLKRFIESALETGERCHMEHHDPVPRDRWYGVEIAPLPLVEPDSRFGSRDQLFLLVFQDLSEAKRIDAMRSDFIANASHELRTPLASLMGYIETLQGPARDDENARVRFTKVMLEQAQRMTRLVNDLLSLSRIEMQSHIRPDDYVDLGLVAKSISSSLEHLANRMGVEIDCQAQGTCMVVGDRDELGQVLENLIENACKYGQEGERVEVSVGQPVYRDEGRFVEVSVRDFGPGIAEEHQNRITERFYRVDVERSREKQGTGLGLAIVKHILNRHGSRLQVTSTVGKGASFSFKLPIAENVKEK